MTSSNSLANFPMFFSLIFTENLMAHEEWSHLMSQTAGHATMRKSHIPEESVCSVNSNSNPWTPMSVPGSTPPKANITSQEVHHLPLRTSTPAAYSAGSSTVGEYYWSGWGNWELGPPLNTIPTERRWEAEAASRFFPMWPPFCLETLSEF